MQAVREVVDSFKALEGSPWTYANAVSVGSLALVVDGVLHRGIDTKLGSAEVGVGFVGDLVDGWLARRLHQDSALGAAIDPVFDKIKTGLFAGALVKHNTTPLLATVGIFSVNIVHMEATRRFKLAKPDEEFKASKLGKAGALVQNAGLGLYDISGLVDEPSQKRLIQSAANVTTLTGIGLNVLASRVYFKRAIL